MNKFFGWIAISSAGLLAGFIVGLIILLQINDPSGYKWFYISVITGLTIGLLIAGKIDKTKGLDSWWNPTNRSADLDEFQNGMADHRRDEALLKIVEGLTIKEILKAYIFQYYDLKPKTRSLLKSKILQQKMTNKYIEQIYAETEMTNHNLRGLCPRCSSAGFIKGEIYDEANCLICDYNHINDNPKLFQNRLKNVLGFYNDRKLTKKELFEVLKA